MNYAAARRLVGEQLTKIQSSIEPLGEWDGTLERLRKRGLAQLSIGQQIRVGRLLARLAQEGNDLSDKKAIADYLISILAFNAQEAGLVRSEFGAAKVDPDQPLTQVSKQRWWVVVVPAAAAAVVPAVAAAALGYWLYYSGQSPTSSGPSPNPPDATSPIQWSDIFRQITTALPSDLTAPLSYLATGLVLSVPVFFAGALILFVRHRRRETILRGLGRSGAPRDLKVPVARPLLDDNATQRIMHALQDWQHLRSVESIEIDVAETIRNAARNVGRPEWHYKTRRSRPLYVLLVDRGVVGDHMGLIAYTIEERLKAAGLVFERYDFTEDPRRLWNASSFSRLTPPESLSTVVARHRGERLLLLSDGEAFGGPVWAEFSDLVVLFSRAVLIDPTPEYRWGERQEAMAEAGLLVVPLSPEGFVRAISAFGEGAEDARAEVASGIGEEIDPFLIELRRERGRYLSDLPLEEDQTRRLIRQIRNYLSRDELYELFVAIAAFPKIAPQVTLYLAESLRGRPIELRQAGLLARLPWLRVGRMPDWLRIALLESLPPASAERLRSIFSAMVRVVPNPTEQTLPDPREIYEATRITVVAKPGLIDRWRGGVFGEHIFIGFMKREPLSIDAPDTQGRPWWRRFDWLDYMTIAAVPLLAMVILGFELPLLGVLEQTIGGTLLLRMQQYLAVFTAALFGFRQLLQTGATWSGPRWMGAPAAQSVSGPGVVAALAMTATWSSLVAAQNIGLALIGLLLCGFAGAAMLVESTAAEPAKAGQEPQSELLTLVGSLRGHFAVAVYGAYCLMAALTVLEFAPYSRPRFSPLVLSVLLWPGFVWAFATFSNVFPAGFGRRDRRRLLRGFSPLLAFMWGVWMALAALLVGSWDSLDMKAHFGVELQAIILLSFVLYFYLERRLRLASIASAERAGSLKFETQVFLALVSDLVVNYGAEKLGVLHDCEFVLAPLFFLLWSRIAIAMANPSLSLFRRGLLFAGNGNLRIGAIFAVTLFFTAGLLVWSENAATLFQHRESGLFRGGVFANIWRMQEALMSTGFLPAFKFGFALMGCSLIEHYVDSSSRMGGLFAKAMQEMFGFSMRAMEWLVVAIVVIYWVYAWGMSLTWMLPPLAIASWWLGRPARFLFIGAGLFAVAAFSFISFISFSGSPYASYLPTTVREFDYAGGIWCIAAIYFWMRYIDDGEFRRRTLGITRTNVLELALIAISFSPAMLLTFSQGSVSINPLPMLLSVLVIAGISNIPLLRPLGLIVTLCAIWLAVTATARASIVQVPFEIAWGISPGQGLAAVLALLSSRVAQFILIRQQSDPSWLDSPKNLPSTLAFAAAAMSVVGICAVLDIHAWRPATAGVFVMTLPIELGLLLAFFSGLVIGLMRTVTLLSGAGLPVAAVSLLSLTTLPDMVARAGGVATGGAIANIIACLAWYTLGIAVRRLTTYGSLRMSRPSGGQTASMSTS